MSKVTQQTEILGLVNDKFGSTITTTDVSVDLVSTNEEGKAVVSLTPTVNSKYYRRDEVNYLKRHLGKYFTGIKLLLDLKPEELTYGALVDKLASLYGLDIEHADIVNPDGAIPYTNDMTDLAVEVSADTTSLTWDGSLQLKIRGYWNSIERIIQNRNLQGLTYLASTGDLPLQLLTNRMDFTDVPLVATLKADDTLTPEQVTAIQEAIGQRTIAGIILGGTDPVWAEDGLYKLGAATVAYNGPVTDAKHATSTTLDNVCVLIPGDDAVGVGGYVLLAYAKVADVAPESYSMSFKSDGTDYLLMTHPRVTKPAGFVYPTGDLTGTLGDGTPIELQWLYDQTYTGSTLTPALVAKTPLPEGVHKIDFKYDGPLSTVEPYPNPEHPWAKLTAVWQWGDITTTTGPKLSNRPEFTTVGKYFPRLLTNVVEIKEIFKGSNVHDIHPDAFSGMQTLQAVDSAFEGTDITTVPADLFAPCADTLRSISTLYANTAMNENSETGLSVLTNVTQAYGIWGNCKMSKLPAHALPPSPELANIAWAFGENPNLLEVKPTDLDMSMYTKLQDVSLLFSGCTALTDVSALTTLPVNEKVTTCLGMFSNCSSLVNVPLLEIFRAFPNMRVMVRMLERTGYAADSADIVQAIQQLTGPSGTANFDCTYMFANTKITGKGADIIAAINAIKPGGGFNGIFRDCTSLSDYDSLPAMMT